MYHDCRVRVTFFGLSKAATRDIQISLSLSSVAFTLVPSVTSVPEVAQNFPQLGQGTIDIQAVNREHTKICEYGPAVSASKARFFWSSRMFRAADE